MHAATTRKLLRSASLHSATTLPCTRLGRCTLHRPARLRGCLAARCTNPSMRSVGVLHSAPARPDAQMPRCALHGPARIRGWIVARCMRATVHGIMDENFRSDPDRNAECQFVSRRKQQASDQHPISPTPSGEHPFSMSKIPVSRCARKHQLLPRGMRSDYFIQHR